MSQPDVKPPKQRRRPAIITFWVTEEESALLAARSTEIGVDRSAILRAALWQAILHPNTTKAIAESGAGTISPSNSGSNPLFCGPSKPHVKKRGSTDPNFCVLPFRTHFEVGKLGVIHWFQREIRYLIGPWVGESQERKSQGNSSPHIELDAKFGVLQQSQNQQSLVLYPRSIFGENLESRPYLPHGKTSLPFTVEGSVVRVQLKHGVLLLDLAEIELFKAHRWFSHKHHDTVYASAVVNGKHLLIHRVLMGAAEGQEIDHRNLNGLDNRRENLRIATRSQNTINRRIMRSNKSGFRGVSFCNTYQLWVASIRHNTARKLIGRFATAEAAARAWDAEAVRLRGEDARLNFPAGRVA